MYMVRNKHAHVFRNSHFKSRRSDGQIGRMKKCHSLQKVRHTCNTFQQKFFKLLILKFQWKLFIIEGTQGTEVVSSVSAVRYNPFGHNLQLKLVHNYTLPANHSGIFTKHTMGHDLNCEKVYTIYSCVYFTFSWF